MRKSKGATGLAAGLVLFFWGIGLTMFAGWVTHIVWVVSNLNADNVVAILIFGVLCTIVAFIGAIHGISMWFGAEWMTPIYTKSISWIKGIAGMGIGA